MRISDWSSDVCSSDLWSMRSPGSRSPCSARAARSSCFAPNGACGGGGDDGRHRARTTAAPCGPREFPPAHHAALARGLGPARDRSEEHTSELQSLMRISYAVFCLKNKKYTKNTEQ